MPRYLATEMNPYWLLLTLPILAAILFYLYDRGAERAATRALIRRIHGLHALRQLSPTGADRLFEDLELERSSGPLRHLDNLRASEGRQRCGYCGHGMAQHIREADFCGNTVEEETYPGLSPISRPCPCTEFVRTS